MLGDVVCSKSVELETEGLLSLSSRILPISLGRARRLGLKKWFRLAEL